MGDDVTEGNLGLLCLYIQCRRRCVLINFTECCWMRNIFYVTHNQCLPPIYISILNFSDSLCNPAAHIEQYFTSWPAEPHSSWPPWPPQEHPRGYR